MESQSDHRIYCLPKPNVRRKGKQRLPRNPRHTGRYPGSAEPDGPSILCTMLWSVAVAFARSSSLPHNFKRGVHDEIYLNAALRVVRGNFRIADRGKSRVIRLAPWAAHNGPSTGTWLNEQKQHAKNVNLFSRVSRRRTLY